MQLWSYCPSKENFPKRFIKRKTAQKVSLLLHLKWYEHWTTAIKTTISVVLISTVFRRIRFDYWRIDVGNYMRKIYQYFSPWPWIPYTLSQKYRHRFPFSSCWLLSLSSSLYHFYVDWKKGKKMRISRWNRRWRSQYVRFR